MSTLVDLDYKRQIIVETKKDNTVCTDLRKIKTKSINEKSGVQIRQQRKTMYNNLEKGH